MLILKILLDLYSLRWKIETIFKNWKSNLKFDKIHNVSTIQLKILLRSRFLIIVLMQYIHSAVRNIIRKDFDKLVSFIKITDYLSKNLYKINKILKSIKSKNITEIDEIKTVAYYCCYDKRNKRNNFEQEMIRFFDL